MSSPAGSLSDNNNASIQIISGPDRVRQHYLNLVRSAQSEILLIIPTINALHREQSIGVFEELQNAIRRGVKIRLLSAEDDFIKDVLDKLRASGIVVRRIETPTETKFKMLVVDKKIVFIIETKDDTRSEFKDAVGNGVLSSSATTVQPYVTIFESFWRETDLYESAREADRVKDEFVHIAAHELRNPIMPIISGADLMIALLQKIKDKIDSQLYDELANTTKLLSRNATKLLQLSEDLLQVSRLESGNFALRFEPTSLGEILETAIDDIKRRYTDEGKADVKLILNCRYGKQDVTLYCDGGKISQTLRNLLDNAMKFTAEGEVIVTATAQDSEIVISVEDSGPGIDPDIRERLFEKFVTKSTNGTGLGLYLCKRIVEAHGGRIWLEENPHKKGAKFSFSVPVDDRSLVAPVGEAMGNLAGEKSVL